MSEKWLTAKYQFSILVSKHSENITKNNPYEFATDILFPFWYVKEISLLIRKK